MVGVLLGASGAPGVAHAAPAAGTYRHGEVPMLGTSAPHAASSGGNLIYQGGNDGVGVTTGAPKVYLVFWGNQWGLPVTSAGPGGQSFSGDADGVAPALERFFQGLGTDSETWSGVATQYCEGVAAGTSVCPSSATHVAYPGAGTTLAGVWGDASSTAPASATAHQLAAEAVAAAAHFGNTTQASNRDAQYIIVSPSGTNPDGYQQGGFCAWHDWSADPSLDGGGAVSSSAPVAFINLPYLPDVGSSCGMNFVNGGSAGLLDGVTLVAGHEYAETLSDQFPAGGWLDSQGNEIADKCAWIAQGQGASQDITLSTGTFAVQSLWANDFNGGVGGCEISHPIVATTVAATSPAITSANHAAFAAGVGGSFTVTATGSPTPTLSLTGAPSGVSLVDNRDGTGTLSASSAAAVGTYALTVTASNGVGSAAQAFTLTVDQAALTYPTSGQSGVDTTKPFTWSTIPEASGYLLIVGTTQCGYNLVNSGVLAATQASYPVPALPVGVTLYATLYAQVGTSWSSYTTASFSAAVGQATLTFPLNGQTGVDPTKAFTWSPLAAAQGYLLTVGTTQYGTNVVKSAILPATQTSYATPILPASKTLYATLYTEVNGGWSRFQAITFTTGLLGATFTHPLLGQTGVVTPGSFTWNPIAGASEYDLVVGTTLYGANLVSSGLLPPGTTSYPVPALPSGKVLYATLFTLVGGSWTYQVVGFLAG